MTDVQLYLAVGIPFLTIVVAMVISNTRINDMRDLLRAEIQGVRTEMQGELKAVRTELTEQRRILERLVVSIDMLTGKVVEIDNRLTRFEERMNRH
jgi:predicted  nucleic acid-binding Zn-ribbon protein